MLGVWVFWCFSCHDISEDRKGDQGGGPKIDEKISGGGETGHL